MGVKNQKLQRQAKWLAIFKFGANLELLNRWGNSIQRYPPENCKELRQSIKGIHILSAKEKNPPHVDPDKGWSPYRAEDFLKSEGLPTRHYHRSHEDEWFAGSDYLEIGDEILKNNVVYYLNGNEHAVTELKLMLNINTPYSPNEAENRFQQIAQALMRAALTDDKYLSIDEYFYTTEQWTAHIAEKQIRLDKQIWQGSIPGGYSKNLSISVTTEMQKKAS